MLRPVPRRLSFLSVLLLSQIMGGNCQTGKIMKGWSTAYDRAEGVDFDMNSKSLLTTNWGCTNRGLTYSCVGMWDPTAYRADLDTFVESNYRTVGSSQCDYPRAIKHDYSAASHYMGWRIAVSCSHSCNNFFFSGTTARGCTDVMVTKIADAGSTVQWTQRMGGSNEDLLQRIESTSDSNIVLGVDTASPTMASPWNVGTGTNPNSGYDVYIGKFGTGSTSFTSPLWQRAFRSTGTESCGFIKRATDNTKLLVGITSNGPSLEGVTGAGGNDAYIYYIDHTNGNILANLHLGSSKEERALDACAGNNTESTMSFFIGISTEGWLGDSANFKGWAVDPDILFCRYNVPSTTFVKEWCMQYGTSSGDDAVHLAYNGARDELVYVVTTAGDWDGPDTVFQNLGDTDMAIGGLDARDGSYVWSDQMGTQGSDVTMGIAVYPNEDFLVVGMQSQNAWSIAVDVNNVFGAGRTNVADDGYINFFFRYPYCAEGRMVQRTDLKTCVDCQPGTATLRQNACVSCLPGTYSDAAALPACKPCELGSFQNSTGQQSCYPCGVGTFADTTGLSACLKCPTGTYSDSEGSTKCVACEQSYYNEITGSTSCKQCPGGSISPPGTPSLSWCKCAAGKFGQPLDGEECKVCPANTKCSFGSIRPAPDRGYWLSAANPYDVWTCVPPEACPGGDESTDSCATGYTGQACSECDQNYYRQKGICKKCLLVLPEWLLAVLTTIGLILGGCTIMLLGAIALSIRSARRVRLVMGRAARAIHGMSSFVRVMQLSGMTVSIQIAWPPTFLAIAGVFQFFTFNVEMLQLECQFSGGGGMSIVTKQWIKFGLVLVLLLLGLITVPLLSLMLWILRPRDTEDDKPVRPNPLYGIVSATHKYILQGYMGAFSLLYVVLHTFSLSAFNCFEKRSGEFYLMESPDIQCFKDKEWFQIMPASIIGIFLFSLGYPIFLGFIIFTFHRKRNTPAVDLLFGSIWTKYDDEFYFWDLVLVFQKFLYGVSLPLAMLGPNDQVVFLSVVSLGSLILHSRYMPMKRVSDDRLEFLLLFAIYSMTFFGCMLAYNPRPFEFWVSLLFVILLFVILLLATLRRIINVVIVETYVDMKGGSNRVCCSKYTCLRAFFDIPRPVQAQVEDVAEGLPENPEPEKADAGKEGKPDVIQDTNPFAKLVA